MNITLTGEPQSSFDVCTNSGYLLETFTLMQQSYDSMALTLKDGQGFSLVPYVGQPTWFEIAATLTYGNEVLVVTKSGGLHYMHKSTETWFECLIAPAG